MSRRGGWRTRLNCLVDRLMTAKRARGFPTAQPSTSELRVLFAFCDQRPQFVYVVGEDIFTVRADPSGFAWTDSGNLEILVTHPVFGTVHRFHLLPSGRADTLKAAPECFTNCRWSE